MRQVARWTSTETYFPLWCMVLDFPSHGDMIINLLFYLVEFDILSLIDVGLLGVGQATFCYPSRISRGVDSSHATWTRVGLESLFL